MTTTMWQPNPGIQDWTSRDITGYKVEAADGSLGKVDETNTQTGAQSIVVDTGRVFGHKVLLPAGVMQGIDHQSEKVLVGLTKDQIKSAPEFDAMHRTDPAYRENLGGYYASLR